MYTWANTDAIRLLLQYDASTNIENGFGETPINVTRRNDYEEALLLQQNRL